MIKNFFTGAPSASDPYQTGSMITSPVFGYKSDSSVITDVAQAAGNLPTSFTRLVSTLTNPSTYINLGKAAAGGIESIPGISDWYDRHATEKGLPTLTDSRATFDNFIQGLKDQYGSIENIKRSLVEDPAGSYLVFQGLVEGGAAAAEKVGATGVAEKLGTLAEKTRPGALLDTAKGVGESKVFDPIKAKATECYTKP